MQRPLWPLWPLWPLILLLMRMEMRFWRLGFSIHNMELLQGELSARGPSPGSLPSC